MIRECQAFISSPRSPLAAWPVSYCPTNIWLPGQPFFKSAVISSPDNSLLFKFKYCRKYTFPSLKDLSVGKDRLLVILKVLCTTVSFRIPVSETYVTILSPSPHCLGSVWTF